MKHPKHFIPPGFFTTQETTQEENFDKLRAEGLLVVPRLGGTKTPLSKYWAKNSDFYKKQPDRATALTEQNHPSIDGWCVITGEGGVFVLDLDPNSIKNNDVWGLYNSIQSLSHTDFVVRTPSGGVHLYYFAPAVPPSSGVVLDGVDIKGLGGQVLSLGCAVSYYGEYAERKGVEEGHKDVYTLINKDAHIPIASQALMSWLGSKSTKTEESPREKRKQSAGELFGSTYTGNRRVERHFQQPLQARIDVTLECLSYILEEWDSREYERWVQMWMSAYHASDGSPVVRDYIVNHRGIFWSDGDEGKDKFIETWNRHVHDETGYTAASCFWLAQGRGWLVTTGLEIQRAKKINVEFVEEWFSSQAELPKRLALMSQTGSGKTSSIKYVWKRLKEPKTVIFVPTTKLAIELHATLKNKFYIPATLYIDDTTGERYSSEELFKSDFLVTTLQTFATRLYRDKDVDMSKYGLVLLEESDQLLTGFARGGGGEYRSHVTQEQAMFGLSCLQEALQVSPYVYAFDATMTQLTTSLFEACVPKDMKIHIIQNTYVKQKPVVQLLGSLEEAVTIGIETASRKESVAIACDTAKKAKEVFEIITSVTGMKDTEAILITRDTVLTDKVITFMQDVEEEAKRYRLVVYNSVMGSGVSISSFTPTVFIQIAGYLTPRANLQLLNRYRKQAGVYLFYADRNSIYTKISVEEYRKFLDKKLNSEQMLLDLEFRTRSSVADLKDGLAAISIIDEHAQKRLPKAFYIEILRGDGREVRETELEKYKDIEELLKALRVRSKEAIEWASKNWREVEPIPLDEPPPPHYTDGAIIAGYAHSRILLMFNNMVPMTFTAEELFRISVDLFPHRISLLYLHDNESAIRYSERVALNEDISRSSAYIPVTKLYIFQQYRLLLNNLADTLTIGQVKEKSHAFLVRIWELREQYDLLITDRRQKWERVQAKYKDKTKQAIAFLRNILNFMGMRLRSISRGSWSVVNYEMITEFIQSRYGAELGIMRSATVADLAKQRDRSKLKSLKNIRGVTDLVSESLLISF
jgi:hypothetical protein